MRGVEPVVLGLAAVDGLHGQGVAEDEGDALALAQVGQPVPGEHALARRRRARRGTARRRRGRRPGDGGQVLLEAGRALVVEDVDEQAPGVEIDAAVVCVLGGCTAASHASLATGRPDPASWLPGVEHRLKDPRRGPARPAISFYLATGPARRQRGHEMYPGAAPDPADIACFAVSYGTR